MIFKVAQIPAFFRTQEESSSAMGDPTVEIDGYGPLPVHSPSSVAETKELVCRAISEKQALYPMGGRTHLNLGMPPSRPGWALDLRGLNRVLDYPARDMTITVETGITLSRLQDILSQENQRLPIDSPFPEQATLGGVLATNTSGPRRLGNGTIRDYIIGIHTINDEGQETKAGGRVVKNVAGYDLCKLHIGALGTLGIVTQVTLKVKPLPEDQALVFLASPRESLASLLDVLHQSQTEPACIEVLNPALSCRLNEFTGAPLQQRSWLVIVGFENNRQAVAWQIDQLQNEITGRAQVQNVVKGEQGSKVWLELANLLAKEESSLTFKANILPSHVAAFCESAQSIDSRILLQAHSGNGIVTGLIPPGLTQSEAASRVESLSRTLESPYANLILTRCPSQWKQFLPVWGKRREDNWLMQDVKHKLDPKGIFNSGRFVYGP